jgi:plastocyanin
MKKTLTLLCSALALGLAATGCGGDDDEDGGEAREPAPAKDKKSGPRTQVTMKNTQFEPKSVTVKKGGTVEWTNEDSVGHDVTKESGPGPTFKSGSAGGMSKGDTYEQTFTTPGQVKYVCTVHPGMEGTVTVK